MSNLAYTVTPTSIVFVIDGKPMTVNKGDDRYNEVRAAIRDKNFDLVPTILDIKGRLISESNGGLYLLNGILRSEKYEKIPALLATRIVEMFKEGFDITPLTLFLDNVMSNPNESGTIVEEIYGFIEACNLPITADGHFLAYKMVTPDFKDIYTRTMDNSVGQVLEMNRADCDFNRGRTCSTGLHFCSEGYLGQYGTENHDQVVVVKVNPRDVTSIPTDYNNAKGRACKYEIVDAISWDDIIKPWFTNEYSEPSPEVKDEIDFDTSGFRWEVRDTDTDVLVDAFVTRQGARDFRAGDPDQYIWDALNEEVVAGARVNEGAFEVEADDYSDDEVFDWDDTEATDDEDDAPVASASAKLNDKTVKQIRQILKQGAYDSLTSLAKMFGVSDRTIRRIRDWESWTHVLP
jgi:hypothetical protein